MEKNLISVNIITRNNEDYIKQSIQSVLDQTYENIEIIIVDDASDDNAPRIITEFDTEIPIRYFRNNERMGISKSRNRGLENSIGEFIAILDGDDFWNDKEKLQKQIDFLKENPKYGIIGTNVLKVSPTNEKIGKIKYSTNDTDIRNKILLRNQFTQSSVLARANVLKILEYNNNLNVWEDYDLWLRVGKEYKFANLSDFSTSYRVHPKNITKEYRIRGGNILKNILKKYDKNYPNEGLAKIKHFFRTLKNILHL